MKEWTYKEKKHTKMKAKEKKGKENKEEGKLGKLEKRKKGKEELLFYLECRSISLHFILTFGAIRSYHCHI